MRVIRVVLAVLCGLFAVGLGGVSLMWIAGGLESGQPHGPSPLFMGTLTLPFAILSGVVASLLYGAARR